MLLLLLVLGGWRVVAARAAAVLGGRYADLVQEKAREIALRREAELRRDLRDLAVSGRKARDRGFDAQHVQVGARREAGAQLEQVVEARARQVDLARQLVHVELFVRPRAQQRDRAPDAAVLEARAAPQLRRGAPPGEVGLDDREDNLRQHASEALGGHEPVVQLLDRHGVGEPADARRERLAELRERPGIFRPEYRRKALVQPGPRRVKHESAADLLVDRAFAGGGEQQLALALLQDDHRIVLCLQRFARRQLGEQQAAEPAFE